MGAEDWFTNHGFAQRASRWMTWGTLRKSETRTRPKLIWKPFLGDWFLCTFELGGWCLLCNSAPALLHAKQGSLGHKLSKQWHCWTAKKGKHPSSTGGVKTYSPDFCMHSKTDKIEHSSEPGALEMHQVQKRFQALVYMSQTNSGTWFSCTSSCCAMLWARRRETHCTPQ